MTRKEMNLRVFRGEPLPHVFFQPRFEPWYCWNRDRDSLPKALRGLSLLEAYDLIGASMRTVHYYTGQPDPVEQEFAPEVRVTDENEPDEIRSRFDTPHGPLFERHRLTEDGAWPRVEAKRPSRACAGSPPTAAATVARSRRNRARELTPPAALPWAECWPRVRPGRGRRRRR